MYVVSQITPLEWKKAPVCHHDDDELSNDHEFHSLKNSSNSLGHEHFTTDAGNGNCSNLETYFKNSSEMNEGSEVAWMSHRRDFLERHYNHQGDEILPPNNFEETLDLDDDGLIGFEDARNSLAYSPYANEEHNSNIELIAYVNNFNLRTCFWWAMGTLIQTTSDLQPKVLSSLPHTYSFS